MRFVFYRLFLVFLLLQVLFTPVYGYAYRYKKSWQDSAWLAWLVLGWIAVACFLIAATWR